MISILKFGIIPVSYTHLPKFAMLMLVTATMWQKAGYNMVIYLAGLQSIPTELMEAATIDGASTFQKDVYKRQALFLLFIQKHDYGGVRLLAN